MDDLDEITNQILKLTPDQRDQLRKKLADAWEMNHYDVVLVSRGDRPIRVIKEVREFTRFNIREAKEITDIPGSIVERNVPHHRAHEMKQKLEAAGAIVELKRI